MEFGYASRETSHKSLVVNPVGPQLPSQRPEGKMPPPKGGQPERLQSERLKHRERWSCGSAPSIRAIGAHLVPASIPFVASSPSKDWPKRRFPKHDVGSWVRWVAQRMNLGGYWPPLATSCPSRAHSWAVVCHKMRTRESKNMGNEKCNAYLGFVTTLASVAQPFSLLPPFP